MSSKSDIAVSVRGLSKSYSIAHNAVQHSTMGEALVHRLKNPLHRPERETFWALKDVDFDIHKGDVVGIIGRNGAGKSTLLKILSRITEPTHGKAILNGRVGSLLEVGTGFHPELTGRENIYLNGAILGMTKQEIARQFDAIVEFSGTEQFLDTPVKRYSSGMYVRLAFAVAAHLNPEILIVDEVLAVGDAEFQKKCLGKMQDVAEQQGKTVLFVSHNMTAVQTLCNRIIWLRNGGIAGDDLPKRMIPRYLNDGQINITEQIWENKLDAPGNTDVRLRRICVRPETGGPTEPITVRTSIALEFEYWNLKPGARLNLSFRLLNEENVIVLNTFPTNELEWHGHPFPLGLFRSVCHIPGDFLNNGQYRIELLVVENQAVVIHYQKDAIIFDVEDASDLRGAYHGDWPGVVRPALKWTTDLIGISETDSSPLKSMSYA